MKVALGLKAHSGWAALVVVGEDGKELVVLDRRRLELVKQGDERWAKQPYHAAENLSPNEAQDLIHRASKAAHREAEQRVREAVMRLRGHEVTACAVLAPNPMPAWSVAEILAVHFRMHKAEGVLFPNALASAAEKCGLGLVLVPEKTLNDFAVKSIKQSLPVLNANVGSLGKNVGPPWGKDQKNAALAAMIALNLQL